MTKYLVTSGVIICAVIAVFFFLRTDLSYIENVTGITFPEKTFDVDLYDTGEFYVVAHVRIPKSEIKNFITKYNFQKYSIRNGGNVFGADNLNKPYREIPKSSDLFYIDGHSDKNRWEYRLDQNTGQLWVVVFYPDFAGDI